MCCNLDTEISSMREELTDTILDREQLTDILDHEELTDIILDREE